VLDLAPVPPVGVAPTDYAIPKELGEATGTERAYGFWKHHRSVSTAQSSTTPMSMRT